MATIKDVAARAGVAVGTASRVLSGSPQTSPASRRLVLAAARDLGYIANGPARSLRRSRTNVLGLLVSDIRNQFFSELAHTAEQEARQHGYTVLLANANEDAEQADAVLDTFTSQRIDGLLLSPQGPETSRLETLLTAKLPIVLLNRTIEGVDLPFFGTDNAGGVAQALAWLQRRGHRDVTYIGGPETLSTGAERLKAYLAGREAHGITTDDAYVDAGDFLADSAAEAMRRVLDRGVHPTAVFGANGQTTLGAIRAIRERLGAEAASRIEVVSFDDIEWFAFMSPPVSAVRHDASEIGRAAVRGLLKLIGGGTASSQRIATSFVDRSEGSGLCRPRSPGASDNEPKPDRKAHRPMKIALGADHAGFPFKDTVRTIIESLGHEVIDCGTDSADPVDFPDITQATCQPVLTGHADRAVLVCGTGQGAVMAANKLPGIRCGLAHEPYSAHQAVEHDDANAIAMGAWLVPHALVPEIVREFLDAVFDDDEDTRRRVTKLNALDETVTSD